MERKGIVIREHGDGSKLVWDSLKDPGGKPGEVLVRVHSVALNHLDTWVRRGVTGHNFGLPRIPGSDVAGMTSDQQRVVLIPSWGCGICEACRAGRENYCRKFLIRGESTDGGCVTSLWVPPSHLLLVPEHLSLDQAAALPLTLLTAWHMLFDRAHLKPKERVLVQAGGSGVGLMAVQLAKSLGCEVHATSGDPARRERLTAMGCEVHDYESLPRNCDVVVESVGGVNFARSVQALAWGGRLVCCGATAGAEASLNLRMLFFKQLSILGSTMGTHQNMLDAWEWVKEGKVAPIVDAVYPVEQIALAHARLESRSVFGKVVLSMPRG